MNEARIWCHFVMWPHHVIIMRHTHLVMWPHHETYPPGHVTTSWDTPTWFDLPDTRVTLVRTQHLEKQWSHDNTLNNSFFTICHAWAYCRHFFDLPDTRVTSGGHVHKHSCIPYRVTSSKHSRYRHLANAKSQSMDYKYSFTDDMRVN